MHRVLTKIKIIPLIMYIALMVLLINLGFWQLQRAEQKRAYLAQQAQVMAAEKLVIDANTTEELAALKFHPVSVAGEFDAAHQFLLDNQHVNGKVGYYVLTPLSLSSGKTLLVNRGWVPLNVDRKIKPDVSLQQKQVTLSGRVNSFPGVGIKIAGAEIPSADWPAVVQLVDTKVLAKVLQTELLDYQVEMDATANEGYMRNWTIPVEISPEKHVAYALQWFGLALTLTLLFLWTIIKKPINE